MPHSKCSHCRARVWRENARDVSAADLCPRCGGELEAVTDLSELVGLRALRARPPQGRRDTADESGRISQRIRETIAAHDAERERRLHPDGP